MATAPSDIVLNDYPTTDHKPMAETDWHRILMVALIQTLEVWFGKESMVYVSGNLLVFYVPGNKRKHVSPDVFVVKGVPKRQRPNFLIWEEGQSLCVVIELTSSTTRQEDLVKKFKLYQDVLKVHEYFLFDPREDYLEPRLQGFRLQRGKYAAIRPLKGRLPSKELGLHLEANGHELRLYDPLRESWLPTPREQIAQTEQLIQEAKQHALESQQRIIEAQKKTIELQEQALQELRKQLRQQNGSRNG